MNIFLKIHLAVFGYLSHIFSSILRYFYEHNLNIQLFFYVNCYREKHVFVIHVGSINPCTAQLSVIIFHPFEAGITNAIASFK